MERKLRRLVLLLVLCVCGAAAGTGEQPAPTLEVTLTPHITTGVIDRLDVRMRIASPAIKAGETLLRMPVTIVSTPTAAYDASAIRVRDDRGPIKLKQLEEKPTPTGVYRHWDVDRDTVGDVEISYGTAPRQVSAQTRNGPLFDLRAQGGGLLGAGVYFMATPPGEQPYSISLKWDMSGAPPGTRGIWSFGEGEQHTVAPAQTLAFSYYAVGPVKSYPPDGKGNFAMYWLVPPPFDLGELAKGISRLYAYMSEFFGDKGAPYRVFIRANPYPNGGGTALAQSFMFSFGNDGRTIPDGPEMLIAHEMVHNWPRLDGAEENHAGTAWYSEGTAEYYAAVLSRRAGVIGLDKFLSIINFHAADYYGNPFVALTNQQAGEKFWSDARAQRVPYGRGFMYLANLDAELRAHSGGQRSLDSLVLEILKRQREKQKFGLEDWRKLVVHELGPKAATEYEDMVAGKLIVPADGSFGPCFQVVKQPEQPFDLGFDEMRLGVVKDLRQDSAAAQAGLQEGDTILSMTPLEVVRQDPRKMMEVTLRRGDRQLTITYLPRRAATPAWHWVRNPSVDEKDCGPVASPAASAPPTPRTATTKDVVHVNWQSIPYTATVTEHVINEENGNPGASLITIAYTRDGIQGFVHRPVMFIFNGGPGASSAPLHMSGLGPLVHDNSRDRDAPQLTENTTSPLDVTDLVFIDPVSTGFSRALPGVDPKQWYNGRSDALAVAAVIKDWLKLHRRETSQLFLCGESYGATRAALILKYAPELKFAGVLLISGGSSPGGPNASYIRQVAAMAAGAWHHKRVNRRGLTLEQFYRQASQFAHGEYADALARGASVSAQDKHKIAEQLSSFIGLPAEQIESHDLKIDGKTYMFNLLKEVGLRTGALDVRVTGPLVENAEGYLDDPALGVVTPKPGSAPPTPAAVGPVESSTVRRYLTQKLKFASAEPYYGVNFTVNSQWTYATRSGEHEESTTAILARAMKINPRLRLFAVSGIFDLQGPDLETFVHDGVPADRLVIDRFPGPHEVYEGAQNRARFDDDVRKFIANTITPTAPSQAEKHSPR